MTLVKARLESIDGNQYSFDFMFNPNQIDISRKANINENRGSRTQNEGIPKVSFALRNAATINIKNIMFDTYENESQRDVGEKIKNLIQSVKFIKQEERPPIYILTWGKINYFKCYVDSLNYQLTLFLPDGTPVRAKASITLKEIDPSFGSPNPSPSSNRRQIDTRW